MNDKPNLAELAAGVLAAQPIADCAPEPDVDERIIRAMEERIARDAKQRTVRRTLVTFAAAAAFALAAGAALHGRHAATTAVTSPPPGSAGSAVLARGDHASMIHDGVLVALDGDTPLATGDRVVASPAGRASIRLPSGTHVSIEPGGNVAVVNQGLMVMFALDTGSLSADVVKLHDDERFVVRTPDAEVEVRGSSFRVTAGDATSCNGRATRVEVQAGTAVVRNGGREEHLGAGERWPSDCGAVAHEAAPPPVAKSVMRRAKEVQRATRDVLPPAPETSELKAQTQLFGDAVDAKRRGDARGAVARFDQYLAQYPDSALAESAAVERMEVLSSVDRARAADAARAYLQRYPGGFARDEATGIVERAAGGP